MPMGLINLENIVDGGFRSLSEPVYCKVKLDRGSSSGVGPTPKLISALLRTKQLMSEVTMIIRGAVLCVRKDQ